METYAEYLEHYGIKGMRWGVIRTPEQLGHRKSYKKRIYEGPELIRSGSVDKTEKKDKKRKARAERKASRKAKEDIARREKILSNPTLLYKHRKEFSKEEIDKAIKWIKKDQELQQLSVNQLSAGEAYLKTAVQYAETGIKFYNKAASIYNAFSGNDKDLPIIGSGGKKKKNKDKSKDEEDD